jgi:tetratricopeptide (TPR) repeat protein
MRNTTIIFAVLLLASVAVQADDITVGRLPYSGATILDVRDGTITFRVSAGSRPIAKPIAEIPHIKLSQADAKDFNAAEDLMKKGKSAEAVALYDKARKRYHQGWPARLIRYRYLSALGKAAFIDQAVEEWMAAVEADKFGEATLKLCPTNLAAKGSPRNAKAIKLLEAKLEQVKDAKYVEYMTRLQMNLYSKEGLAEKAAAVAEAMAGKVGTPDTNGQTTKSGPRTGNADSLMSAVEVLLKQSSGDKAFEIIDGNIDRFDTGTLPRALLLRGKARVLMAKSGNAGNLLRQAGLDFMRIVAHYPESVDAGEALFLAGQVNASLPKPNYTAARTAWQQVLSSYGGSGPLAKRAQKAIDQLPGRGKGK